VSQELLDHVENRECLAHPDYQVTREIEEMMDNLDYLVCLDRKENVDTVETLDPLVLQDLQEVVHLELATQDLQD